MYSDTVLFRIDSAGREDAMATGSHDSLRLLLAGTTAPRLIFPSAAGL